MTTQTNQPTQSFFLNLQDKIEYPQEGILSNVLLKDSNCQYTLFCLAAETEISEHTSTRNATVNILAGNGTLTLEGKEIALSPGVFVFMKANAPHALKAEENLAFLLTLSESEKTN
ncbi:cupin domain-containing protein [Oscillatoria salina]|uniref:cupin domain-containing protein n=1 Tax=Oscillatoria salina TaxID=331517 RepID=UPI0013B8A17A|nr:cupin domain-containing protein [Oscillatoria salina]MBZ8179823.1 cupin domain-containing protein [Oscillatoria salina IIICB1]NET88106.1 cupin domain-containing protein [Kamptonema sp. SIO1D9]